MRNLILLALLPLAACGNAGDDDGQPGVPAQGSGATRTYAVSDFTAISLRGSDDVDVRVGPGFTIRAEGDPKVLDRLKIEKVGDTLRVGRISSSGINWGDHGHAKIFVTMPRIAEANVAGSGDMSVDRVEGAHFEGNTAGSGDLAVKLLTVDQAKLAIAGSGTISVAGTAKTLNLSIAGSGDVHGDELRASSADISIAGSGSVRAKVEGSAKVSMMGSGDVDLGGAARCQVSKMGSGTVRCG